MQIDSGIDAIPRDSAVTANARTLRSAAGRCGRPMGVRWAPGYQWN
jgi:hypothetical protein